jgi:hypothetical protein
LIPPAKEGDEVREPTPISNLALAAIINP